MKIVTLQNDEVGGRLLACVAVQEGVATVHVGIRIDGFDEYADKGSRDANRKAFLESERYGSLIDIDIQYDVAWRWLSSRKNLPCATNSHRLRLLLGETVQLAGGWTVSPL